MAGLATNLLILCIVLAAAALLLWPRVVRAMGWRATVTPLGSIIGSGFLILGPILAAGFGLWAPAVMAGLCTVAYAFGAAIRLNIAMGDALIVTRTEALIENLLPACLGLAIAVFGRAVEAA